MNNTICYHSEKKFSIGRNSNIELLRIVSMFLVLVVHADYLALGAPSVHDISISYGSSFVRAYIEALSCICVNAFILISGWFGIRFKFVRLAGLLFQIYFINIVIYIVMRSLGFTEYMSIIDWIRLLFLKYREYWFVKAYLILYVFAPVLNAFVDNCSRSQLKIFLIGFYILQSIYGFYASSEWYSGGYSPLSFMGLYLFARYMRLYPYLWMNLNKFTDMTIYLIISALTSFCALAITPLFEKGSTLMFLYSSPLVILATIHLFLFFSKLSFNNRFINWVSISAFAVYLLHCSIFIFQTYYLCIIKEWFETYPLTLFLLHTTTFIGALFFIAILIDKVRIAIWNGKVLVKRA